MEENKLFLAELMGKLVSIQVKGGSGIKDLNMTTGGDYKGVLLGFDGNFIKIQYEVSRFVNGKNEISTRIMIINVSQVITMEESKNKD